MKIEINKEYYILTKRTVTKSNYNVNISLFRNGEKMPICGQSMKNTSTKKDFENWAYFAILRHGKNNHQSNELLNLISIL